MIWLWIGFTAFVLVLLALDLGVFHRKARVVSMREALGWSAVWISLGLAFGVFVYFAYEHRLLGIGQPPPGDTTAVVDLMAVAPDNPQGANGGAGATVKYLTGTSSRSRSASTTSSSSP